MTRPLYVMWQHIKHIGREELCSDLQVHYMHYVPTDWHHCVQKGQGLVAIYSNDQLGAQSIGWVSTEIKFNNFTN